MDFDEYDYIDFMEYGTYSDLKQRLIESYGKLKLESIDKRLEHCLLNLFEAKDLSINMTMGQLGGFSPNPLRTYFHKLIKKVKDSSLPASIIRQIEIDYFFEFQYHSLERMIALSTPLAKKIKKNGVNYNNPKSAENALELSECMLQMNSIIEKNNKQVRKIKTSYSPEKFEPINSVFFKGNKSLLKEIFGFRGVSNETKSIIFSLVSQDLKDKDKIELQGIIDESHSLSFKIQSKGLKKTQGYDMKYSIKSYLFFSSDKNIIRRNYTDLENSIPFPVSANILKLSLNSLNLIWRYEFYKFKPLSVQELKIKVQNSITRHLY